ncbi:hypothetical protein EWW49_33510 [Pseudomonas syringae]|nr:hypothetical protein EWW49_33510 [Pseudomonas syringae]
MKKAPLLNIDLSRVNATLGYGDILIIDDAGMTGTEALELVDLELNGRV